MIERGTGQQVPLVLLPGWGFTGAVLKDHVAFAAESLLVPTGFTAPDSGAGLLAFLNDHGLKRVRILGWSMGGNIGVDFAQRHPDRVSALTLVAVRQRWHQEDIELTRQGLLDVTGRGMEKFYRKCFLGAKSDYRRFASQLLMSYTEHCDVALLDKGLTYLSGHRMPDSLSLPVHIVQGRKDLVCPVAEMVHFSSTAQISMLDGVGHFPFSHVDFSV